ncbi:MalY/PatB family protein [Kitasatospora sp. McL0602]|uniref:MalY/PatB family protein n=1 Tax=Kitasatospora sp. McL0602 TaxID=3439530 RepID=UPI003F8C3D9C
MEAFDRTGTGSVKWARAGAGRIALGLADMDLPGPPEIGAALAARARHGAYGYTVCDPGGRELVARWYRERHGALVDPEWVLLMPFSARTALRLLLTAAEPDGPVLSPTPEWGGFEQLCRVAGMPYRAVPLELGDDGYRLPVAEFAGAAVVLLSNPHNPSGRVWPREDIRALAELAAGSGGLLVSDEVHGDLVQPDLVHRGLGLRHTVAVDAAGQLARHTVTLNSVGKTFNTSGIPSCFALVPDPGLRERLVTVMAGYGLWEGGLLPQLVQQAALRHGGPWLDGLLALLAVNRQLAADTLSAAVISPPEASYLLWLDATELGLPAVGAREALLTERDVELSAGTDFGAAWAGCLRLNYALPTERLQAALTRLHRL